MTTTHKPTIHDLRRMEHREPARCVFCEETVEWDPPADMTDSQQVGDWNIGGDFGCNAHPDTDEDGTAGHLTVEDVAALERQTPRIFATRRDDYYYLLTPEAGELEPGVTYLEGPYSDLHYVRARERELTR